MGTCYSAWRILLQCWWGWVACVHELVDDHLFWHSSSIAHSYWTSCHCWQDVGFFHSGPELFSNVMRRRTAVPVGGLDYPTGGHGCRNQVYLCSLQSYMTFFYLLSALFFSLYLLLNTPLSRLVQCNLRFLFRFFLYFSLSAGHCTRELRGLPRSHEHCTVCTRS